MTDLLQLPNVLVATATPSVLFDQHSILVHSKLIVVNEKPFQFSLDRPGIHLEAHQFRTQRLPSLDNSKGATPHFRDKAFVRDWEAKQNRIE
jgi:hypothetical protein